MARIIIAMVVDALILLGNAFQPLTTVRGIIIALASIGLILSVIALVLRMRK